MKPLPPCPSSPNCVSSMATDAGHAMAPLRYAGSLRQAQDRLEALVRAMPRATIVHSEPGYFAAEFRSLLFRFVDDVAFSFDEAASVIHFRSGSRTGYSDLGVNRKRMEQITAAFVAQRA